MQELQLLPLHINLLTVPYGLSALYSSYQTLRSAPAAYSWQDYSNQCILTPTPKNITDILRKDDTCFTNVVVVFLHMFLR